jgi:hypothetical protein
MTETINERREELAQLEQNYQEAERLQAVLADLLLDLQRTERQRDAFAVYAGRRIEVPNPTRTQALGLEFELQPFQSVETGRQLADRVEQQCNEIRKEIKRHEQQIADLLKG